MKSAPPARRQHRGIAGVVSSASAGLASLVAGIVVLPIVMHYVGSGPYGVWLLISVVANYLNYSDLGVGTAIVHFGSRARGGAGAHSLSEYLSAGLLWNAVAVIVITPIYFIVALSYTHSSKSLDVLSTAQAHSLTLIGAAMLVSLLVKPFGSALTGAGLLPIDRRNQLAGAAIRVIGTLIACLGFRSILGVAAAEVAGVLLPAVVSLVYVLRHRVAHIKWDKQTPGVLHFMLSYSVRSFANNAVGALLLQAGTFIVALVAVPSHVTYFNAAFRIYSSVRQIMGWMTDPYRPALSRLFVAQPKEATKLVYSTLFGSLVSVGAGCFVLIAAAGDIVHVWLGTHVPVAEVTATVVILLTGLLVNAIHVPLIPAGDASGRPGAFFPIQCAWLVAFCGLGYFLGRSWDIAGVAAAMSLPLLVIEPLYLLRARSILGINIGGWLRRVLLPTARLLGGGVIAALAAATVASLASGVVLSFWTAAAFLAGVALCLLLPNNRKSLATIQHALKVEL